METPLGRGYAIIFESNAGDDYWRVILQDGAIVTFRQEQVRAQRCYTYGRISDHAMKDILAKARKDHDKENT